jgi:glutamate carboxypeptidase
MRALLAGARRKQPALLELIRQLVRAESPSDDKAAVDVCVELAAAHARALGGRVKLHRQRGFGNVLEARFGPKPPKAKADNAVKDQEAGRILLLGHLDTVWPLGTLKTMPCRMS